MVCERERERELAHFCSCSVFSHSHVLHNSGQKTLKMPEFFPHFFISLSVRPFVLFRVDRTKVRWAYEA